MTITRFGGIVENPDFAGTKYFSERETEGYRLKMV
jgi:hypothetical protein